MQNKLWRFTKGLFKITTSLMALVFIIYTLAWLAFTKRAETYIDSIWHDASWQATGIAPKFTGYPLPPELSFSGRIQHKSGFYLESQDLYYFGFPLLGHIQFIEAPKGFNLGSPILNQDVHVDYAAIQMRLPYQLPIAGDVSSAQTWQKSNAPISIPKMIVNAGTVSATGSGTISIDEKLQIIADMNIRVFGMDSLLDSLKETQGDSSIDIARSFLNMLSQKDEKTGQTYFETTLKIQNRGLYLGPMRIASLPEIKWTGEKATLPRRHAPE